MATRWTSKHTGQKIDDTIDCVCNPNLLDNWYFPRPVNQRGQTEYTAAGYTIDRWKIGAGEKLTVLDGCCRVECKAASGRSFAQIVEENLAGKTVTFSALVKAISNTAVAYISTSSGSSMKSMSITGPGLWSMTVTIPDDVTGVLVQVNPTVVGDTVDLIAAKLELGSQQTLAHQDADGNWILNEIPDYGEQLRRCQRYFVQYDYKNSPSIGAGWSYGQSARIAIYLPCAMRSIPVISNTATFSIVYGDTALTVASINIQNFTGNMCCLNMNVNSGLPSGFANISARVSSAGSLGFSADL